MFLRIETCATALPNLVPYLPGWRNLRCFVIMTIRGELMKWQDLENLVRSVAGAKFSGVPRTETIAGVKCDCVIRNSDGSVVVVEISKERTLAKLRTDLAKFATVRPYFISLDIFPRCFFITQEDPTDALKAAGEAHKVQVFSVYQFMDWMFALGQYHHLRKAQPFGSSVNLYSGKPDEDEYVPVDYISDGGESYDTERITLELVAGKTIVLIGDFGSGKSRCAREVFNKLIEGDASRYLFPVAINLRENWGLKRATELITRHFEDLGMGRQVPDVMKIAFAKSTIYLLDGFDEIGAQTWSDDPTRLVEIRKESLAAVKDVITRAQGGILVAGREHYFNDDAELLQCLGVDRKSFVLLRCQQEVTAEQFAKMVGSPVPGKVPPDWVPRKPLLAKIIREIDPSLRDSMFESGTGQVDFWDLLIDGFCTREARIRSILEPTIIRELYGKIGRLCRSTKTRLGPLSIKSINDAFESVTGRPPTDESAIVLQRLPGLGRIGAESLDRQFVDQYILDGLQAEDVLRVYSEQDQSALQEKWAHAIGQFGAFYISTRIESTKQVPSVVAFIKRHKLSENRIVLSDLISSLYLCDGPASNFIGWELSDGSFQSVDFGNGQVDGIHFKSCYFEQVDLTDAAPQNTTLLSCVIGRMAGVGSQENLPDWFQNCAVEAFQDFKTLTALRKGKFSTAQTFLLASLRKLFLQPGAGRKRSSMFKGFGDIESKRISEKVLGLLKNEKFCTEHPGKAEQLYIPNRSMTARAKAILNQMTQSNDPLWKRASALDHE